MEETVKENKLVKIGDEEIPFDELMAKVCFARTLKEASKALEILAPFTDEEEYWILYESNLEPEDRKKLHKAISIIGKLFWGGIKNISKSIIRG